jgi:hypothetical protein
MALTVTSYCGENLEFKKGDEFYFEMDQIKNYEDWEKLADACKNNGDARIQHHAEHRGEIGIYVRGSIVIFLLNKYNDSYGKDYYAQMRYQLNAKDCENAFREAARIYVSDLNITNREKDVIR